MLGTASYAHSFSVAPSDAITSSGAIALYPPANKADQPRGPYDTSPPCKKFLFYNILNDTEQKLIHSSRSVWKSRTGQRRIRFQRLDPWWLPYCRWNQFLWNLFYIWYLQRDCACLRISVYLNCYSKESQPFIYAPKPEIMFSYDDARSFGICFFHNYLFMRLIEFSDQLSKETLSRRTSWQAIACGVSRATRTIFLPMLSTVQ